MHMLARCGLRSAQLLGAIDLGGKPARGSEVNASTDRATAHAALSVARVEL